MGFVQDHSEKIVFRSQIAHEMLKLILSNSFGELRSTINCDADWVVRNAYNSCVFGTGLKPYSPKHAQALAPCQRGQP